MDTGHGKWVALLRGVNVGGHNKVPFMPQAVSRTPNSWRRWNRCWACRPRLETSTRSAN